MKSFLSIFLFVLCLPLAAQTPSYEELEFELDSTTATYKPASKNFVLVRSKRGASGLNKTAQADAITSAEVTEIVLVFSETDASDLADREVANQERWENLLKTYPEFFQFSTTYKSLCQCKIGGDAEAFKQSQGFYIFVNGEVPKVAVETPKAEEPKAAAPKVEEKKAEAKVAAAEPVKTETRKAEEKKAEEKKADEKAVAAQVAEKKEEAAPADRTAVKAPEEPKREPREERKTEEVNEEKPAEVVRAAPKKKSAVAKARRAKNPKACRVACYGSGDEDLHAFFKDNLKLSKKERKKAKKNPVIVKLQLNVDGTIKKAMVTCPDEKLNLLVTEAIKSMNPWNASVKSGLTVKSEVKMTLKYDKPSKSLKPFEVSITPRLGAKCPCASDSELFD